MFFLILYIFKNIPSLAFKCPPKDITLHTIQPTVLLSVLVVFVHLGLPAGEGFMFESLGLSWERQRLSRSKLEGYKTIKAVNKVMMDIFPQVSKYRK